jgi:hypothetical protein
MDDRGAEQNHRAIIFQLWKDRRNDQIIPSTIDRKDFLALLESWKKHSNYYTRGEPLG